MDLRRDALRWGVPMKCPPGSPASQTDVLIVEGLRAAEIRHVDDLAVVHDGQLAEQPHRRPFACLIDVDIRLLVFADRVDKILYQEEIPAAVAKIIVNRNAQNFFNT